MQSNDHDTDMVAIEDACPSCGQRHMDSLVWIDDEQVRCESCGATYQPGKERHHDG